MKLYESHEDRLKARSGGAPSQAATRMVTRIRKRGEKVPAGMGAAGGDGEEAAAEPGEVDVRGTRHWKASESSGPRLVRMVGVDMEGEVYPLRDGGKLRIGREEGDVVFRDDPLMSRRHATLELQKEKTPEGRTAYRCILRDENSRNGVFVKIREDSSLKDGDQIAVGRQVFRFSCE